MITQARQSLVAQALIAPESLTQLSALQWDLLVRQARRANLLAKLALLLDDCGRLAGVPSAARLHLQAALRIAERQQVALRWEVECIRRALADVPLPVILLKGAAYAMAGLPASRGRMFADVDVLVPRALIAKVESALTIHGWRGEDMDAYDQHYYRAWMHEIPPMRHMRRSTSIDVHHTILPEIARSRVNTAALFQGVTPIPGHPGVEILQPTDMLLHSAAHLFHEGELENGLRDLFDLDGLLRDFGRDAGFWAELVPRAKVLGLARPLYYALRYTSAMLNTPVPPGVLAASAVAGQPSRLQLALMDACYVRALQPMHGSCDRRGTWLARLALYVRSHWLRMPLHLLSYHLLRKALKSAKPIAADAQHMGVPPRPVGDDQVPRA
nr:nucleotidyltransferase family protein [uncultured Roseateles sp.]